MNLASNNHFSLNSPDSFQHKRGPSGWQWSTIAAACLALLTLATPGETIAEPATRSHGPSLDPAKFAVPEQQYRPVDCWWWDGAKLDRARLRWQLEDMHAKGVGGTWLYPRFHHSQAMSSDPGFWTEGWWEFVKFTLDEQERLGMRQWANDWLGRFDKNYFQTQLMAERDRNPALQGIRLVAHRGESMEAGEVRVDVPASQTILTASAYKRRSNKSDAVAGDTRIDLADAIVDHEVRWQAPEKGWSVIVVASEPHGLDYIGPEPARRWIELVLKKYQEQLGSRLGKSLVCYGPDERFVLNGNILYSDKLRQRIKSERGYDPLVDLPALFVDVGDRTDKVRCDYYDTMVAMLESNFYHPIAHWLHDHGMQQATIATWGREDLLGQVQNYGDFFRMMRHFDIPGNEDSVASGEGAFIDGKLSSSIAHLNGRPRVAVCAYWGTGWGFTQQENIARTNVNYALGTNLLNTHGVMYSLMGGRNEFVPPEVHFYQPYWQTWRTHYDSVARLSYVLSQGDHRADVAIVYPISTLHAQWYGGSKFDRPARDAQNSMFGLARTIYHSAIDFDFIDEVSISEAKQVGAKLQVAKLEFPVVVLPQISTIRADAAIRLRDFVVGGGTLLLHGDPPTASAERGRNDVRLKRLWEELLGDYSVSEARVLRKQHASGGQTILVRGSEAEAAAALKGAITPDVKLSVSDVIHTHQQVGKQHVYFFVNRHADKRSLEATVSVRGTPEIWDARTGEVRPLHRFQSLANGTRLRLELDPYAGVLVVMQPEGQQPEVIEDNLASVDEIRPQGDGFDVVGTMASDEKITIRISSNGDSFVAQDKIVTPQKSMALAGPWDCEYHPTMDNRWGDFRYPATDQRIGPEMPIVKFRDEPANASSSPSWHAADLDDSGWRNVTCTYGPYWQVLGPFDQKLDSTELTKQLVAAGDGDEAITVGSKQLAWEPYAYSQKFGAQNRDVHQTYDGIGPVSPNFFVFGRPSNTKSAVCYLRTQVWSPTEQTLFLHFGDAKDNTPREAWINGKSVVDVRADRANTVEKVVLRQGQNSVILRIGIPYRKAAVVKRFKTADERAAPSAAETPVHVATFAVFLDSPEVPETPRYYPLSPWYLSQSKLVYDCRPTAQDSVGWFRFQAPPGARQARLSLDAEAVEGWVNGERCEVTNGVLKFPASSQLDGKVSTVALRVKNVRGIYEGAVFREPIAFDCGRGSIPLGDWSKFGLQYYSGGVTYIKTVRLTQNHIAGRVLLDLGEVRTSAEVTVNGQPIGVRLAKSFVFDISNAVRPGENEIRVNVLNTLANYMSAQPSRFVFEGQTVSGLMGPASLHFPAKVSVHCARADD